MKYLISHWNEILYLDEENHKDFEERVKAMLISEQDDDLQATSKK